MSLIKFNNRNRLFPSWNNDSLKNVLSNDVFFNSDLFEDESFIPAMNVKEHKNYFEIEFAAPGFSKEDFEITIDDNFLNVCGEKKEEIKENKGNYTRQEFNYNSFKRSLNLPETINTDQEVKATYKKGILKLNLLKKEGIKEQPKKIIEVL